MFLLSALAQTAAQAAGQDSAPPPLHELPDSLRVNCSILVHPEPLQVGDPFQLFVDVSWDKTIVNKPAVQVAGDNEAFELFGLKDSSSIVNRHLGPDGIEPNRLGQSFTFKLAAFETGELQLPDVEVSYTLLENGERRTAEVVTPVISIAEFPPDDEQAPDIREIRDALDPQAGWRKFLMFGGLALAAALVAALLVVWRRRRKGSEELSPGPQRPIEEVAYEQLLALENSRLLRARKFKEYYGRLSWIVRNYLEGRYQFAAVEMTSAEIETIMGEYADAIARGMIVSFDECSDLAKFAKWKPSIEEGAKALSLARNIVARTTALAKLEETAEEALEAPGSMPPPAFKKDLAQGGEGAS